MLTVKPVSGIIPTKALQSSQDQPQSILKTLSPGRLLKAEVIQGGKENALLQWGNVQFRAESKVLLQEGQKLNLLVTENSAQVKLKILGDNVQVLRNHWPILTEKNLLPRLLDVLTAQPHLLAKPLNPDIRKSLEFYHTYPESSDTPDLERVVLLLRMLGINFPQAKEGDGEGSQRELLKTSLEKILAELKEPDSGLARKLETVLGGLQKNSLAGQEGKESEAFFTLLPLPFLEKGFLVVQQSGHESRSSEEPSWRLSLFLETKSLGELRIDFLHQENGLFLKIISESSDIRTFLESCQDELRELVSAVTLRGLTFEAAQEPPGSFLLKQIAGGEESILETWA
jgi:hypothetical protein